MKTLDETLESNENTDMPFVFGQLLGVFMALELEARFGSEAQLREAVLKACARASEIESERASRWQARLAKLDSEFKTAMAELGARQ